MDTSAKAGPGVSGNDRCNKLFVSRPLAAQTISNTGTVKGMVRSLEVANADNFNPAFVARVVSSDGTAVRGTLLAVFGGGTEFPTAASSVKFPAGWISPGTTLTSSVTAQDGDRLTIELGFRATSTSVNNGTLNLGRTTANPDLGETEGETANNNPWIEFSQDLLFLEQYAVDQAILPHDLSGPSWDYGPNPFREEPFPVSTVVAQLFLQALDAIVIAVASLTTAVIFARTLSAVVTTVGLIQKQVNKIVAAVVVTVASLQKQVNKTLVAVVLAVATLQALKVILKALNAVVTTVASLQKQVNKPISAVVLAVAAFQKQVNKTLAAVVLAVGTLQALKVILKVMTATVVTVASIRRQINLALTAVVIAAATITKRISKTLAAVVSAVPFLDAVKVVIQAVRAGSAGIVHFVQNAVGLSSAETSATDVANTTGSDVSISEPQTPSPDIQQPSGGPDVRIDDITP